MLSPVKNLPLLTNIVLGCRSSPCSIVFLEGVTAINKQDLKTFYTRICKDAALSYGDFIVYSLECVVANSITKLGFHKLPTNLL